MKSLKSFFSFAVHFVEVVLVVVDVGYGFVTVVIVVVVVQMVGCRVFHIGLHVVLVQMLSVRVCTKKTEKNRFPE